MAITIQQQPASPNYSISNLVYVLSSTNINQTEFSIVVEITVGGVTFTFRKQSNPSSRVIIDIADITNDNLEYEVAALGITSSASAVDQSKSFGITFSEEYLVDGALSILNPITPPSIVIVKGVGESDQGSLTSAIDTTGLLSDVPQTGMRVHRDDNFVVSFYDTTTNVIDYRPVTIPTTGSTTTRNFNGVAIDFEIYDDRSDNGEVILWWFNRRGGLDWFTADEEGTKGTNVNKTAAASSRITHGFTTSSNREPRNPNVFKSSSNTYAIEFEEMFAKNTRWLTQELSDYVSGLFDSPMVFEQVGSEFRPVEILNTAYDARTRMRSQDLFNYEIMYTHKNSKRNI